MRSCEYRSGTQIVRFRFASGAEATRWRAMLLRGFKLNIDILCGFDLLYIDTSAEGKED